jgi:hypothetical protein
MGILDADLGRLVQSLKWDEVSHLFHVCITSASYLYHSDKADQSRFWHASMRAASVALDCNQKRKNGLP